MAGYCADRAVVGMPRLVVIAEEERRLWFILKLTYEAIAAAEAGMRLRTVRVIRPIRPRPALATRRRLLQIENDYIEKLIHAAALSRIRAVLKLITERMN